MVDLVLSHHVTKDSGENQVELAGDPYFLFLLFSDTFRFFVFFCFRNITLGKFNIGVIFQKNFFLPFLVKPIMNEASTNSVDGVKPNESNALI